LWLSCFFSSPWLFLLRQTPASLLASTIVLCFLYICHYSCFSSQWVQPLLLRFLLTRAGQQENGGGVTLVQ
jgi:hypothetical protein